MLIGRYKQDLADLNECIFAINEVLDDVRDYDSSGNPVEVEFICLDNTLEFLKRHLKDYEKGR